MSLTNYVSAMSKRRAILNIAIGERCLARTHSTVRTLTKHVSVGSRIADSYIILRRCEGVYSVGWKPTCVGQALYFAPWPLDGQRTSM